MLREYKFTFTAEDVQKIYHALTKRPYDEIVDVVVRFSDQVKTQEAPPEVKVKR